VPAGVALSLDSGGRLIAIANSHDANVAIADCGTGAIRTTLKGHTAPVRSATFTRDGMRIATASADGTTRIWDATTGTAVAMLDAGARLSAICFSPDGGRVATAGDDNLVRIWEARASPPQPVVLRGHQRPVISIDWSTDGASLATGSRDITVKLWNPLGRNQCETSSGAPRSLRRMTGSAEREPGPSTSATPRASLASRASQSMIHRLSSPSIETGRALR